MSFEERLKQGEFCVAYCNNCDIVMWPHSSLCSKCFLKTQLIPSTKHGTLLEYSSQNDVIFCVCRMGDVDVMGQLLSQCAEGSSVYLSRCGIRDDAPFFEFTPVQT